DGEARHEAQRVHHLARIVGEPRLRDRDRLLGEDQRLEEGPLLRERELLERTVDGTDELGAGLAVLRLVLPDVERDEVEAEDVEVLDQSGEAATGEALRAVLDEARADPLEVFVHRPRVDLAAERAG